MKPARLSRKRTWGSYLIFSLFFLSASSLYAGGATQLAKARASYQKKQAAIEKKFLGDKSASVAKQYTKLLSEYVDTYRAEGKLDEFLTAKEERERFQTTGVVEESDLLEEPEFVRNAQQQFIRITQSNQRKMQKQQAKLAKSYIRHLKGLQKKLMQKYLTNQALLVKEEIETVKASVDFNVLAPAKKPTKAQTEPLVKQASPTKAQATLARLKPVAKDRLVVFLQDQRGPIKGVKINLNSHTSDKSHSKRTDRKGQVEFITKPDSEYTLSVIGPKYEPFIQPHCISGESFTVNLLPLPRGVKTIQSTSFGEFKLPGFASIRFSGSYTGGGGSISGVRLTPRSPKLKFPDCEQDPNGILFDLDIWLPVTQGPARLEMKIVAPSPKSRLILYRTAPRETVARGAATPPARAAAGVAGAGMPAAKELVVHAIDVNGAIRGLKVTCKPNAPQKVLKKRTDDEGHARFKVDPDLDYTVSIINKKYEPFVQQHCTGGEPVTVELIKLAEDIQVITMKRAGEFKLPGISKIDFSGYGGKAGEISGIHLKPSSPKTTFSIPSPYPTVTIVKVDTWVTVTERSHNVEFKVIAPDASTRIILYRKLS